MEEDYNFEQVNPKLVEDQKDQIPELGKKTEVAEVEPTVFVTINQFATFVGGTESVKINVVNGQKNPPEETFFWYQSAKAGIRRAISSSDIKPIFDAIDRLKKLKVKGKQKERNRLLSIEALEAYKKIQMPLEFRQLNKTFFKPKVKHYDYFGIRIKITPDLVFRASKDGKETIGAIKININKTKPFSHLRMRVVSFLLYRYLKKNVAKGDEIVDPQNCICIDVFGTNAVGSQSESSAPKDDLKRESMDYIDKWQIVD